MSAVTTYSDAAAFNAAERGRASQPDLRDRIPDDGVVGGDVSDGSPDGLPDPATGEVGQPAGASGEADRRGQQRGLPRRSLAATLEVTLEEWVDAQSWTGGVAIDAGQRKNLLAALHLAIQAQLKMTHDFEVAELETVVAELGQKCAFYESTIDSSRIEVLRQLQHAYNAIGVLVAMSGGEVHVPQAAVYESDDSELKMENLDDGRIRLATNKMAPD
jgi:hypothetical protein